MRTTPGQLRGLAALEDDMLPSPDHNLFRASKTPTNSGQQRTSQGSILPRTVGKPQSQWRIHGLLGLMKSARGKSSPTGQRGDLR